MMFGTLSQAVDDTGMDIDAEANRMALLPQNLKARDTGNARDEAMAEYFTPEERAMVEKIAVRDKDLLGLVRDVQTPEQAKELRDLFFGVPEPTAEDAVDQGLAPAFEEPELSLDEIEARDIAASEREMGANTEPELSLDEIEARDIAASEREMGEEKAPAAKEEKPKEDYTQQAIYLFQTCLLYTSPSPRD